MLRDKLRWSVRRWVVAAGLAAAGVSAGCDLAQSLTDGLYAGLSQGISILVGQTVADLASTVDDE